MLAVMWACAGGGEQGSLSSIDSHQRTNSLGYLYVDVRLLAIGWESLQVPNDVLRSLGGVMVLVRYFHEQRLKVRG